MHRIIDLSAVLAGFLVERLREAGIAAATSAGHDAESERWVVTGVPNASTVYIAKSDDIERAVAITHAFMAEQNDVETICDKCGYDLNGHDESGNCPECGDAFVAHGPEVTCASCGESGPGEFDVCWNCGAGASSANE